MNTTSISENVQISVPFEIVNLIFDKDSGSIYQCTECNIKHYNVSIYIPCKYRGYVNVVGNYPDIDHAPRLIQKHVDKASSRIDRREIIVHHKLLQTLRTKHLDRLKAISKLHQTCIHFTKNGLILLSLCGEVQVLEQVIMDIRKLLEDIREADRCYAKEQTRIDFLHDDQIVSQPWFAKDVRRPANNVI